MRYKTRDIGEGGIDLRVAVSEAWLAAECPDSSLGISKAGMCLEGRLEQVGEGYLLRGTLRGELLVPCARCLEPAPVVVDSPVVVTFVEAGGADKAEADDTEEDVVLFEHGTIDVGRPIRDEILLAVPMGPVCRPDCAGICPSCGRNRNLTPCDCDNQALENSKFGVLAKMKLQ
jgi:DUF177 domain-containing protein